MRLGIAAMTSLSCVSDPMRDLWMRARRDCGFGGKGFFFAFVKCLLFVVMVVDCDSNNDS